MIRRKQKILRRNYSEEGMMESENKIRESIALFLQSRRDNQLKPKEYNA
jgi:hypothetical protein